MRRLFTSSSRRSMSDWLGRASVHCQQAGWCGCQLIAALDKIHELNAERPRISSFQHLGQRTLSRLPELVGVKRENPSAPSRTPRVRAPSAERPGETDRCRAPLERYRLPQLVEHVGRPVRGTVVEPQEMRNTLRLVMKHVRADDVGLVPRCADGPNNHPGWPSTRWGRVAQSRTFLAIR